MEKFTFKFKNGKFLLKESYESIDVSSEKGTPSSFPEIDMDSTGFKDPETKNKPTNIQTISQFLESLGFNVEEIKNIYREVKNWGNSLKSIDTQIVFDDSLLNKGLSEPSTKSDDKKIDSDKKFLSFDVSKYEEKLKTLSSPMEKIKYIKDILKDLNNSFSIGDIPQENEKEYLKYKDYLEKQMKDIASESNIDLSPDLESNVNDSPKISPHIQNEYNVENIKHTIETLKNQLKTNPSSDEIKKELEKNQKLLAQYQSAENASRQKGHSTRVTGLTESRIKIKKSKIYINIG